MTFLCPQGIEKKYHLRERARFNENCIIFENNKF